MPRWLRRQVEAIPAYLLPTPQHTVAGWTARLPTHTKVVPWFFDAPPEMPGHSPPRRAGFRQRLDSIAAHVARYGGAEWRWACTAEGW